MKPLTDEQVAIIRREQGRATAKELADRLKVPRASVEQALAQARAPARRAEHPALVAALALALLVAAWTAYGNNADAGFHFDDVHAIQNNQAIRALHERIEDASRPGDGAVTRARTFVRALAPTARAIYDYNVYRMVTYWSFALTYHDHPLDGKDVDAAAALAGWHAWNNAIHALNALLVLWVAWLTLTAPALAPAPRHALVVAFLAALLFAVHPIQVQAVTYLTQRTESLCATFYLLSLGLYMTARRRSVGPTRGAAPWMTPVTLGAAGAILALAALLALVTDAIQLGGLVRLAGLVLLLAAAAVVALVKTGRDEPVHAACTAGAFAAFALALQTKEIAATLPFAIVAWDLTMIPGRAIGGARPASFAARVLRGVDGDRLRYLAPWAAIVVAGVALILAMGGRNIYGQLLSEGVTIGGQGEAEKLSGLQYLLTQQNALWTYVRLVVLPTRLHLDHDYPIARGLGAGATWLSFVSAAMLIALLYLLARFGQRARVAVFGVVAALLVLSVTSTLVVLPDIIFEHRFYLPLAFLALPLASAAERVARRYLPGREVLALLGLALPLALALGAATRARNEAFHDEVSLWKDVTEKSPAKPRGWTNLALAHLRQEPWAVAVGDRVVFGAPRRLPDGSYLVHSSTSPELLPSVRAPATAQARQLGLGLDEAIRCFQQALALDPDYQRALSNLAVAYVNKNIHAWRQLDAVHQLGTDAERRGDAAMARRCLEELVQLEAEAWSCYDQAIAALERVIALDPDDALTLSNYANLLAQHAEQERAVASLTRALEVAGDAIAPSWTTLGDLRLSITTREWYAARDAGASQADALARTRDALAEAQRCYERYLAIDPRRVPLDAALEERFRKAARDRREVVLEVLAGRAEPPKNLIPAGRKRRVPR